LLALGIIVFFLRNYFIQQQNKADVVKKFSF